MFTFAQIFSFDETEEGHSVIQGSKEALDVVQ